MATSDKVDKQWQSKGLGAYSTAAILGSLTHYGAPVDEAGFKALAERTFPLGIAEEWHKAWKGTGQFAKFPAAAADELWKRLTPERLQPSELALALVKLMHALEAMREGKPDAPVGERFKAAQALKAKLPMSDGKPNERFVAETAFHMGDWLRTFNSLAESLAKDGHIDDAEELAGLEEALFPPRAGVSMAVIRAAKGEKDAAVADLSAIASKAEHDRDRRLTAVDALIHLDAYDAAKAHAVALFDLAESTEDHHFAMDVGERLKFLVEKGGPADERRKLLERLEKVHAEHAEAHPHHRHG